jgi:voltage-gated potassium channel
MVRDFVAAHINLMGELSGVLVISIVVIVAAAFVIARFDRIPLGEAMYLAFITAFTVGFGDLTPRSSGARVACVVLAFLGLILVGVLVAVAVHALDIVLVSRAGGSR